jgi:hypothetical protein
MSSLYLTQPFLLKTSVCILILLKCQKKSASVTYMFPHGDGQDSSLLVNCKGDRSYPGSAGIKFLQTAPSPPPSLTNQSAPHPPCTHAAPSNSLSNPPCLVGSGNILVRSPGEKCSIYSPGRLGLKTKITNIR